jgi:NAD+ kinase
MPASSVQRLALLVHPARPIENAVASLTQWADQNGLPVVQLRAPGSGNREVAELGELGAGDLIVALGGDGTVLSALRASAAVDAPVLGAACGSLGALTAVRADGLVDALERTVGGDWLPWKLPALAIKPDGAAGEWAVNDFVAVRHGAGQLVANVSVDGELYVRLAGDGVIVATGLGSSGYSMAAGGPILADGASAIVVTPLAMHGGSAAPLVVPASSTLQVQLHPGFAGFEVEIDGHNHPASQLDYTITLEDDRVTLVAFSERAGRLTRLRERRLITDSPRVLARDDRSRKIQV